MSAHSLDGFSDWQLQRSARPDRLRLSRVLAGGGVVWVLVLVVLGTIGGVQNDHGHVQPTSAVVLSDLARPARGGAADCSVRARVTSPRVLSRTIALPCGSNVHRGQAIPVYVDGDNDMSFYPLPTRSASWVGSYVFAAAYGMVAFVVIVLLGLALVRYRRRAYFS